MLSKRITKISFFIILTLVLNLFVIIYANVNFERKLILEISSSVEDEIQIFWGDVNIWDETKSQKFAYENVNEIELMEFIIPNDAKNIRLDFGSSKSSVTVFSLKLKCFNKYTDLSSLIEGLKTKNDISSIIRNLDTIEVNKMGNDSYIVFELDDNILESNYTYLNKINFVIKSVLLIIVNLFVFVIYNKRKSIFSVTKEIYDNKDLVWSLSKNDFKTKYAGSYLGIFWAFVNPIVTILIYWFVFEFGLKAGAPIPNVPFILWFTSGLIPWFFFSDAVINATNSFIEYSYLVKKVVFKISILPVVKIISSMFIHLVFVVFIISIFAIYGKLPNLYMIQIIYYSFCIFILSLAISYATSALIIFFKDLSQIIGILLQVGMWMTPIMWSYTMIPQNLQWIFKLNPMFYIVEGYRDTLINNELFYNNFWGTLYFWTITAFIFITGMIIFRKMKPHFSDVL